MFNLYCYLQLQSITIWITLALFSLLSMTSYYNSEKTGYRYLLSIYLIVQFPCVYVCVPMCACIHTWCVYLCMCVYIGFRLCILASHMVWETPLTHRVQC